VRQRAEDAAEERVLDALLPKPRRLRASRPTSREPRDAETRQKFRKMLREGSSTTSEIEIEVRAMPGAWRSWRRPAWRRCSSSCRDVPEPRRQQPHEPRKLKVKRGAEAAGRRRGRQADQRRGDLKAARAGRTPSRTASSSSTRSTRSARRQESRWRGRVARGRAARPAAAGRGLHRLAPSTAW
jgi:hypothetical protein